MTAALIRTTGTLGILLAALAVAMLGLYRDPLLLRWTGAEGMAAAVWVGAPALLLLLTSWSRWWPAIASLVVVAGLLVSFGPAEIATSSIVVAASFALGSCFLARDAERPLESALLAGVLGLGVIATIISWVARVPIHFDFVYVAVLMSIVVVKRRACRQLVDDILALNVAKPENGGRTLNRIVGSALIALLLYACGSSAIPETGYDALTIHYALLHELKAHGQWNYDVTDLRFTLMPKLAVWAHSPFMVIGGEMAMRGVNLLAVAATGFLVAARITPAMARWQAGLLVATFLSLPLTIWLTTMLSEDPVSALFYTAAVIAFLRMWEGKNAVVCLYVGLALLGMAVASKAQLLMGGGLGVAFVLTFLIRQRTFASLIAIGGASLMFFVIAAFPYLQAFALTGNPFYPFDPGTTVDGRWSGKLSWALPYTFTFRTIEHLESYPGALGLFPILALGAFVCAVLFARNGAVRIVAAVLALFVGGMIVQSQYVRYLYYVVPAMLACVGLFMTDVSRIARGAVLVILTVAVGSNVALMRSTFAAPLDLDTLIWPERAPTVPVERRLYAAINATGAPVRVLVAGKQPYAAGLDGRADVTGWYGERLLADRLTGSGSSEDFLRQLHEAGVTHVSAIGGFSNLLMERICNYMCQPALEIGDLRGQFFVIRYPSGAATILEGVKYGPLASDPSRIEERFLRAGWSRDVLRDALYYPGVRSVSTTASLTIPRRLGASAVKTLVLDLTMVNAHDWRSDTSPEVEVSINNEVVQVVKVKQSGFQRITPYFGGEYESGIMRLVVSVPDNVSSDRASRSDAPIVVRLRLLGAGAVGQPRETGDFPVGLLLKYLVVETGSDVE